MYVTVFLGVFLLGCALTDGGRAEGVFSIPGWLMLLCAGVMAVVLPIHIYMAAFAPGEGPALRSMFSGFIPVTFIRHHNPLWYEQLVRKGVIRPETTNTLS